MLTDGIIRQHLDAARNSLDGWSEPNGFLVPTEPDSEERARIRERLGAVIFAYQRVLEIGDEGQVTMAARRMGLFEHPLRDRDLAHAHGMGQEQAMGAAISWLRERGYHQPAMLLALEFPALLVECPVCGGAFEDGVCIGNETAGCGWIRPADPSTSHGGGNR